MQDSSENYRSEGHSDHCVGIGDSWLESLLGRSGSIKGRGDNEYGSIEHMPAHVPSNNSQSLVENVEDAEGVVEDWMPPLALDVALDLSKVLETSRMNTLANREEAEKFRKATRPEEAGMVRCPANLTVEKIYSNEEYISLAELYFARCNALVQRPTMSGLALALGLSSISGIERLGLRNPGLRSVIGRSFLVIQHFCENDLFTKGATDGAKFTLKNIPDGFPEDERDQVDLTPYWKDTKQIAVTGNLSTNAVHLVLNENITPERAYEKLIRGERVFDEEPTSPEGRSNSPVGRSPNPVSLVTNQARAA